MHGYKHKHQQYQQHQRQRKSKLGSSPQNNIQKTPQTAWNKFTSACCFPAFWLLMVILAIVFGMFFVILGKDKMNGITDWRDVNGVTQQATKMPNNTLRDTNSTFLQQDIDILTGSTNQNAHQLRQMNHQLDFAKSQSNSLLRHQLKTLPNVRHTSQISLHKLKQFNKE